MNNKTYGVLKSKVEVDNGEYTSKKSHLTHYNLITVGDGNPYQVNIDIQSNPNNPNVRMLCIPQYENSIIKQFDGIAGGFTPLDATPNAKALDYLRQNLFPQEDLFAAAPMDSDAISKTLDPYLNNHENIIVFGTQYGHGYTEERHYGLQRSASQNKPGTGVDDVHFNQGSTGFYAKSNGIYQDGGLFIENTKGNYTAFFFAFSEQCSKTDDNGNCIE